ncbi:hypothetical protein ACP4OV_010355 [Aristida adscensionis]
MAGAPKRGRKWKQQVSPGVPRAPFTMKKQHSCSFATLVALMVALAAGSLAVLVHPPPPRAAAGAVQPIVVVHLQSSDSDEAAIAMRTDDLSLAGFANRSHHWHAFPGHEHLLAAAAAAAAAVLPFGGSYRDLIGGLANLPALPLGRAPMAHATGVLAAYDPAAAAAAADGHDAVRRALATMTVIMSEAQRLRPISETVSAGWESGEARVAGEHLPYIEHWDTICYEVLRAHRNGGVWDGPFTDLLREHAGIHGEEEALAVVEVLVNRTMSDLLVAHARRA